MKVGFGLVTCQRYPGDPRTAEDLYAEALELAKHSESVGLDSIWMSEHHFWDDDYMPSLLVTASAMAAVTTRITIGTAVLLAPLYDPLRLAEDAATVDLISKGRFVLGLGIGWRQEEFDLLKVPMTDVGKRISETVRILRRSWKNKPFEFHGDVFDLGITNVTPKPKSRIPILIGGFAPPALRRAGRIGDGFIGSTTRGSDVSALVGEVNKGLQARKSAPADFQFAFHKSLWFHDDEDSLKAVLPHQQYIRWKYADMGNEFGRASDGPLPAPSEQPDLDSIAAQMIHGNEQQVADQISALQDDVGKDIHFIARSYFPGMSLDTMKQQIDRLAAVKQLLT